MVYSQVYSHFNVCANVFLILEKIMQAVVLKETMKLEIQDIELDEVMGDDDVEISIKSVGICGSDVHYYEYGRIGDYIVSSPMILGHEASGVITKVGKSVKNLKVGDRVCMEPGIPSGGDKASLLGMYNLDPAVKFWATPPYHGCLRESVIHPAAFTFKLPEAISYDVGAFVEPFAVGVHAVSKAKCSAGSTAVVIGAGTIGICTAVALKAGGYSKIHIIDVQQKKIDFINSLAIAGMTGHCCQMEELSAIVRDDTDSWGVDAVFESSGAQLDYKKVIELLCPGGVLVLTGMPMKNISMDVVALQSKEIRVETIFRYANVYEKAVNMMVSSGFPFEKLISKVYPFQKSVEAFDQALKRSQDDIKIMINI